MAAPWIRRVVFRLRSLFDRRAIERWGEHGAVQRRQWCPATSATVHRPRPARGGTRRAASAWSGPDDGGRARRIGLAAAVPHVPRRIRSRSWAWPRYWLPRRWPRATSRLAARRGRITTSSSLTSSTYSATRQTAAQPPRPPSSAAAPTACPHQTATASPRPRAPRPRAAHRSPAAPARA